MKVRNRLYVISSLSLAVIFIMGLSLYAVGLMTESAFDRRSHAVEIMKTASEMRVGLRYVVQSGTDVEHKHWLLLKRNMWDRLQQIGGASGHSATLLNSLKQALTSVDNLYAQWSTLEQASISDYDEVNLTRGLRTIEDGLFERIEVITDLAVRLEEASDEHIIQSVLIGQLSIFVLLGVLAIVATWLSARMARQLNRSIGDLEHAIADVTEGDLTTRPVPELGKDELGQLAHHFNTMVHRLRETTVSRDTLQQEVASRTRELLDSRRSLEQSENKLRNLFDNMGNGVAVFVTPDEGKTFLFSDFNKAAEEIGRIGRQLVIGKPLERVFRGDATVFLLDHIRATWQTGKARKVPITHYRDRFLDHWFEGYGYKLNSGEVVFVYDDVTERKAYEDRLRQSAIVFESTAEGVLITDIKARIIDVNHAFTEITQYEKHEVIGQHTSILQSGRHDKLFYDDIWQTIRDKGFWSGEIWNRKKDGTIYPEWLNISCVRGDDGEITQYVGVFTDITEIKRSQEELDYLAHHDMLTGLPNRLLMNATLEQAIKHARRMHSRLGVVFVDLDRFKNINDSMGHQAGDELLKEVAHRLRISLREEDTVARISGDEFVILLTDISGYADAEIAVEKIMANFHDPILLNHEEIRVTGSLGVCLFPDHGDDVITLLKHADTAMYQAKDEGRNSFMFYRQEYTEATLEKVRLENALRVAAEQNELFLMYQPQFELDSGRIVGVEALLRWQNPKMGLISPADFIPVAEQSGLMLEIGAWVLRQSCLQAVKWLADGMEFGRVSVNVSGPQLQRGEFAEQVRNILQETGLPPSNLELEVTETFIMQNAEQAIGQLEIIRRLGVSLAIDDFGTGYSSLAYLKKLPIQKLKIDRSFVRDIPSDEGDMAITEAIIALGQAMDLLIIAEGVETVAQQEYLQVMGCHEVQGFLYSKPLLPEDLKTLVNQCRGKGIAEICGSKMINIEPHS